MARDNRLDTLKGILIILVILGHVIQGIERHNYNVINHGVMGLIYIFHMPLFTLISGYLTNSPDNEPSRVTWRRILDTTITLIIFQLLSYLWIIVDGGDVRLVLTIKSVPFGILWYLMSLIYWRIMLWCTPRALLNKPYLYLLIALVISVLSGFTGWGNPLALQRTLNFYIFFLIGFYHRQGMIDARWWNNNRLHAALMIVLLAVIFFFYPNCGRVMNGAEEYGLRDVPEKLIVLACSISISVFLFNTVRDNKWLRVIGRDSMFYYLYHIFIVNSVLCHIVKTYHWPTAFPFVLLYTTVVVLVLVLLSKVTFLKWLTHPTRPLFKRQ